MIGMKDFRGEAELTPSKPTGNAETVILYLRVESCLDLGIAASAFQKF